MRVCGWTDGWMTGSAGQVRSGCSYNQLRGRALSAQDIDSLFPCLCSPPCCLPPMFQASACIYLVIAGVVAAGLDGLQRKLELPAPGGGGAAKLPTTLPDALAALEADKYIVDRVGPDLVRWFVGLKKAEIDFIDKRIEGKMAGGMSKDAATMEAWQHVYMEFV